MKVLCIWREWTVETLLYKRLETIDFDRALSGLEYVMLA